MLARSTRVYQDLYGRGALRSGRPAISGDEEEAKRCDNGLLILIMPTCPDEQ